MSDRLHTAASRSRPRTTPCHARGVTTRRPSLPPAPEPQSTSSAQRELRDVAATFAALKTQLKHANLALGQEGIRWLTAQAHTTELLRNRTLAALAQLSDVQGPSDPVIAIALFEVAAIAQDTIKATACLATAIAEFPAYEPDYDPPPGNPTTGRVHDERQREVLGIIRGALDMAAHTIELCEHACLRTAVALANARTGQHPTNPAVSAIEPTQHPGAANQLPRAPTHQTGR